MTRARWALAAAVAAAHGLAAAGYAFGSRVDEAYFLRLARALRNGAYALPGPFGGPVSDPLPGWPLLLSPLEALLGETWGAYRWVGAVACLGAVWLAWRLARRLLDERAALVVAAAAGLSPCLLALSGSLMADAAFAGACAGALLILARGGRGPAFEAALGAAAALAALLRPEGALLVAAVAFSLWRERGPQAAVRVAGGALAPLSLWLLRNAAVMGHSGGGYALNFLANSAGLSPAAWLLRASDAAATIGGAGAAGLVGIPLPLQWAGGVVLLILAGLGAKRRWSEPVPAACAVFAGGTLLLHAVWGFPAPRHAAPLLAPLWILAASGFAALTEGRRRAALAAAALAVLAAARADLPLLRPDALLPPPALAATAEWARRELPEDARLESVACQSLALLSGRDALCSFARAPREAWIAALLDRGARWAHDPGGWSPDGFFPPAMAGWARERARWLGPPYFVEAFSHPAEGRVWRLSVGDERAFLSAVRGYERAGEAARAGDLAAARASLDAALALEPRLAQGWALRALLEPDAAKSLSLLRRAAAADPGDAEIALELEARLKATSSGR